MTKVCLFKTRITLLKVSTLLEGIVLNTLSNNSRGYIMEFDIKIRYSKN